MNLMQKKKKKTEKNNEKVTDPERQIANSKNCYGIHFEDFALFIVSFFTSLFFFFSQKRKKPKSTHQR